MEIASVILQSLLAFMFLFAGITKLAGTKMHVDHFDHWRLPQWFRIVTGIVEVAGAAALIVGYWEPSWMVAGALILGVTAIGGVLTHLRVKDPFKETFTIFVIGVIAFVVFFANLTELSDFPGFN